MTFVSTDPVSHKGKTNTWLTPLSLIRTLGEFDLDPCGFPGHETAKRLICLPEDGLSTEWTGRVWLNPPYGKNTGLWLSKLEKHGNGIALVFARTDTKWFHDIAASADAVCFLSGRLSFLNERFEESSNAGAPSMLLSYGRENISALWRLNGRVGVLK